jgi:hypothetical protein
MTTNSRRFLFVCLGALLLGVSIWWLASSASGRYRAESRIVVQPYTNAIFTRSFESQAIQTIPGIIQLKVTPMVGALPKLWTPTNTNGAGIQIVVVGASALEAQRLANEGAAALCAATRKLYGGTAEIVERADRARPYSFFHDRLQPGVARLFKR